MRCMPTFLGTLLLVTCTASAEDLVLCFTNEGYEIVSPEPIEEHPLTAILWSLRTRIQVGEPFETVVVVGNRTIEVSGTVTRTDEGTYRVATNVRDSVDTGERVPIAPDVYQPILDETASSSTQVLELDTTVVIGGIRTSSTSQTETETTHRKTDTTISVVLTSPSEPAAN
jgi:hypothetical protein